MFSQEDVPYLKDSQGRTTGYSIAKDLLKVMPADTKSPTMYLDVQMRSNKMAKKLEREGFGIAMRAGVREALREYKEKTYTTPIFSRFWQAKEIIAQSDLSNEDKETAMAEIDEQELRDNPLFGETK